MTQRVHLDPRRLDKRIRIEALTTTKGASGGMVKGWALQQPVWAGLRTLSGSKVGATGAGGGDVPEATHEVEAYYIAGVTPTTHRIVHGSTIYEILHVNNVQGQGAKMVINCKTGVSRG